MTIIRLVIFICGSVLLQACATVPANQENQQPSVITATQVTFSLTSAILQDTGIQVINVPADGRRFDSLKDYIQRRKDQFKPIFENATAVVSLTNALPSDPLFRFAREANIKLVNIDAAQPWSYDTSGVTLVASPTNTVTWQEYQQKQSIEASQSKYFWLSLTNAVRMADIVGTDLVRVFPYQAEAIATNRDILKQQLLDLFREYQNEFLEIENLSLFALANEFVYLTNDLGLYVDGYFLKQDIDWTHQDLENLVTHLKLNDIRVVLHKWQPKQEIVDAIESAGARLVVLDTADPGLSKDRALVSDGYQHILRSNLDALLTAMKN